MLQTVYRRIKLRVVPFLILLYVVAFLDRVNIGFAALTMNRDLHLGEDAFGFAAGVFFLGYLIFGVPSNILLAKFGPHRWIAIILIIWGMLSSGLAFVHGPAAYIVLRFLLGAAEAGFFPGVILYLTTWVPPSVRAGLLALFTFAIPISNVLGAPLSAAILQMRPMAGLHPWQLLFLLEGIPAIFFGCLVPLLLAPGPEAVPWLNREEKQCLEDAKRQEATEPAKSSSEHADPLKLPAVLPVWPFRVSPTFC